MDSESEPESEFQAFSSRNWSVILLVATPLLLLKEKN